MHETQTGIANQGQIWIKSIANKVLLYTHNQMYLTHGWDSNR